MLALILLVSDAQVSNPVSICVMEEELIKLKSLHCVVFYAWHQFLGDGVEIAHICCEVCQGQTCISLFLAHESVVNWHLFDSSRVTFLLCNEINPFDNYL